ncbi:uncharacterized protein LOC108744549 isoform X1 [Agrilus planipennis]|uniref:Uncharacterized protein LOC108744549 isoform X1 n=1 Tax=Agrilus planipennis TaxID=224129 RepID=A0A7F5QV97_AGRPL|nr:uncharacterized protein LOC108744549 isoform X1 [Agrilus planipennis]
MVMSLEPGFLDFDNLPDTNFSCVGKVIGGYYADLETNCQMFHVCTIGQLDEPMDIRFLCLNGTVFDQETRVCERIDEVDCSKSEKFYSLNLELYGNTQPPLLEETPETESSFALKKPSTTTTTTTTTSTPSPPPKSKSTSPNYYNNHQQTTVHPLPKEITSVHLPVGESSDIRFNPLEINVNLKPQAPPIIKTQIPKPISFHHQSYVNDNPRTKVTVTTAASNKPHRVPLLPTVTRLPQTSPKVDVMLQMVNSHTGPTAQDIFEFINQHQNSHGPGPTEVNFGFTFHDTESSRHTTENPNVNYHFHHQAHVDGLRPPPLTSQEQSYIHSKIANNDYRNEYSSQTTASGRDNVTPSKRLTPNFHQFSTEKPHGLQLPLPALPHLHPLSFSSPAPFSLNPRIESKRYTQNSNAPRIVISARASVSDNNGRRLNYSLGTIGETELVGVPVPNYEEYKDDADGISYYEDDDKDNKKERSKRSIEDEIDDFIKADEDGIDVLKYLYDWYSKQEEQTTVPSLIAEINYKLAPLDPEIAESRGEYALKTVSNPPSRKPKSKTNSQRKPFVKDRKEIGAAFPIATTFNDDHSEEEFGSTFGTPFGGFENKPFDFARDTDHSFFDKDSQDSFEVFKDTPNDDDFPNPDLGDVEEHIEKDDKKGRKYSYKKIVLSQATGDDDKEVPHGKSIVKNNKVISHETFSEFTNFTDYDDHDDPKDPKIQREHLTTEKVPQKEFVTPDIVKVQSGTTATATLTTFPITTVTPPLVSVTTVTARDTTTSMGTTTTTSARSVNSRGRNNSRRRSRYRTTTRPPEIQSMSTKRNRNSQRRTTSRTTTTTTTTTEKTTTSTATSTKPKYEKDDVDYEIDDSYTLSPSTTAYPTSTNSRTGATSRTGQIKGSVDYSTARVSLSDKTTAEYSTSTDALYTTQRSTTVSYEGTTPLVPSKSSQKQTDSKLQNSDDSSEEITEDSSEEDDTEDTSESSTVSTTTLKTSLPLEDIFNYFVSTPKIPTNDLVSSTTTETNETIKESDHGFASITEVPSTTVQNDDYTETVKSLIHDIEQKTKSVVNEKDIQNLTEMTTTDNTVTIGTLVPDTLTISTTESTISKTTTEIIPSRRHHSDSGRSFSGHRFAVDKHKPDEPPVPKLLHELLESVKQAFESTTPYFNYLSTYETTSEEDSFDSSEYLDNNFNQPSTTRTTLANDFISSELPSTEKLDADYSRKEDSTKKWYFLEEEDDLEDNSTSTTESPNTSFSTLTTEMKENSTASVSNENQRADTTTLLTTEVTTATETATTTSTTTALPKRRKPGHRFGATNKRKPPSHRLHRPSFGDSSTKFSRRRRPNYQKTKVDVVASYSENNTTERSRRHRNNQNSSASLLTEQPLSKNVSPTQSKDNSEVNVTPPYSKKKKARLREDAGRQAAFTCFKKDLNKFYSDPRDCRLFHYCTPGYSKSQIVDMKFVCDLGTYFDDEKLVCSKTKPSRCL